MHRHLTDAIALNLARQARYSALSEGRSESISQALIAFERRGLLVARALDAWAARFWRHGILVGVEDFVPMQATPAFKETFERPFPDLANFRSARWARLTCALLMAVLLRDFSEIYRRAAAAIEVLPADHRVHAMLRHFLESIARSAWLAPGFAQSCRERGVPSSRALSRFLILVQVLSLPWAAQMDKRLAPFAARGLPIGHNDVPPIRYR